LLRYNILIFNYKEEEDGDWGLGIGDWGLGIGDWAQSPIPNPQSPIPNPQSPLNIILIYNFNLLLYKIYNNMQISTIIKFIKN